MNIRTFWLIVLKIIGISLVLKGINIILHSITTLSSMQVYGTEITNLALLTSVTVLATLAIYFFILWLFVFKTAWLIKVLHLEEGFPEDKVDLSFQLNHILNIVIIVCGAMLIIDSLPELCKQIFTFFQVKNIMNEQQSAGWIIFYFVKTILGYILITNSRKITSFIDRKTDSNKETSI